MKNKFLTTPDSIKIAINHFDTGKNSVLIIAPGWFMTKDSKPFYQMSLKFSGICDVICMDFRGHGQSGGFYTFSAKEPGDLKTVIDFAKQQYQKIYLMGFSLGAGMVLIHNALYQDIDKIIAVSPYCDFNKIENQMYKKEAWLPTLKKFEFRRIFSVRPSIVPHKKIKPIDIADKITAPTLFLAGKNDPTVHLHHTQTLYKKAKCKKAFEVFDKSAHAEDLFIWERDKFVNLVMNWLYM